jgi:hypothetical protein
MLIVNGNLSNLFFKPLFYLKKILFNGFNVLVLIFLKKLQENIIFKLKTSFKSILCLVLR